MRSRAVEATVVFASPAALRNVVATAAGLTAGQQAALGRVRLVMSAGAPVPASAAAPGPGRAVPNAELHTPYGMTEALPVADIDLAEIEAAGPGNGVCVGRPVPGVEVRLSPLDRDGRRPAPHGRVPVSPARSAWPAAHVKDCATTGCG